MLAVEHICPTAWDYCLVGVQHRMIDHTHCEDHDGDISILG